MMSVPTSAAIAIAALAGMQPLQATMTVPPPLSHVRITEMQARDIAWRHGLMIVEEISRSGHVWELAGRDRAGLELALDIDSRDGSVIR